MVFFFRSRLEQMKAYCITLNRSDPLRAQTALREIQRLGVDCEFADGVDLKQHDLARLRELLTPRAFVELQRGRQVHEALSGLGSVGCYLAHYRLWQRCAAGSEPIAIFEDDVQFQADAPQRVRALLDDAAAQRYDILRLIYMPMARGAAVSPLLERVAHGWSASAYVLQPRAAQLIVKHALPMEMHCDYYLDFVSQQHGLQHYCPRVPLHINRALGSTIGHSALIAVEPAAPRCSAAWVALIGACLLALLLLVASLSWRPL